MKYTFISAKAQVNTKKTSRQIWPIFVTLMVLSSKRSKINVELQIYYWIV